MSALMADYPELADTNYAETPGETIEVTGDTVIVSRFRGGRIWATLAKQTRSQSRNLVSIAETVRNCEALLEKHAGVI